MVLHVRHRSKSSNLITSRTGSLLILPQAKQQLPELLLASSTRTAFSTLTTQINQLCNSLPAGTAGTRIFSLLKEFVSLATSLRNALFLLGVVVLVEVVDVLLGGLYGLLLLGFGFLGAVLEGQIAAFAPLLDNFGLFFLGDVGLVGGLVGGGCAGDGAAWGYTLSSFSS
jgi:hypothetical protein